VKRLNRPKYKWNITTTTLRSIRQPPKSVPPLLWPTRMLSMKLNHLISGILKMLHWFPASAYLVVTGWLNEIMELQIALPRVKYAFDFPFHWFLNKHWVWFWRWLTSNRLCITIKKQYMQNVVVLHCIWQVYFVSIFINNLSCHIWFCALVIERLCRPRCSQVLAQ